MAAIIDRSTTPSTKWLINRLIFGHEYREETMVYNKIFETRESSETREEDQEIVNFGLATQIDENNPFTMDTQHEGSRIVYEHIKYGMGYQVSEEEVADNKYESVASARIRALAYSMAQTKEIVHANVLNNAFDPAYPRPDATSLCAADHRTVSAGLQSNLLTAAAISEANLEAALKTMRTAVDSRGLALPMNAKSLIIHPNDEFLVHRILKSAMRVNTANNDTNAIKDMGYFKDVIVNRYQTDENAFFITTDIPNGLLSFQRTDIILTSNTSFDTGAEQTKATERYTAGCTDYHSVYGSPGF